MQTRRIKLHISHVNCEFWLLLFCDQAALEKYLRKRGATVEAGSVEAFCSVDTWRRTITIGVHSTDLNRYVTTHEATHAAFSYARLNRRTYTQPKWNSILTQGFPGNPREEILANVCAAVNDAIWSELTSRFQLVDIPEAQCKT